MITGALLLPVRGEISVFYKKRIPRVLWPFLIWSVIYNLFPWITGVLGIKPEVILDFFPYSGEEVMRQSLPVSLDYIAQIPFNFSIVDVHMWYIYLLIGLYLYLPVFSAWVEKGEAVVSRCMGCHSVVAILQPVCGTISLGNLFMECVRHALLLCRFQWLSVVGTLSAQP